jgi:hypothetical protein
MARPTARHVQLSRTRPGETHLVDASPHQEFAMHERNLLIYDIIAQRGASSAQAKEFQTGATFAFSWPMVTGQKAQD